MSALQVIKNLKNQNQDFEWYPTTREIIEAMYWDMVGEKVGEEMHRARGKFFSMLDIGAGNCKVFDTIKQIAEEQPLLDAQCVYNKGTAQEYKSSRNEHERLANRVFINKYMVIEKSQLLIDLMPREALVVGVDFNENTLIDKQADIVFCNPPYSEYERWASKIIREANAKHIYLVIPQRWGKHKGIAQALKDRKAKAKIIGNFDFLNAEDRKARAYVSLVKISLNQGKFRGKKTESDTVNVDPFDLWFHDTFKIDAKKTPDDWHHRKGEEEAKKEHIKNELVGGRDLVSVLVQLYNKELEKLIGNYMKLSELDHEIFKELNVDVKSVLEAFKEKIKGLKNLYWQEVFSNLSEITKRLTSKTRERLLTNLAANTNIDFNESNIRAVVIWVIKNANSYFESQMLELYDTFTTEEGIRNYKSNKHFVKDDFRYNKRDGKLTNYALEYRVVLHYYLDYWAEREGYASRNQIENLKDIIVVARNLGFEIDMDVVESYGQKGSPYFKFGGKDNIYFCSKMRILKKGTKTLDGKIEAVYVHTNKPNENGERVMEKDGVEYVYDKNNKTDWVQYKINDIYLHSDRVAVESDIFTTVKTFKNGNCHFQFNQEFMKKFNLEVGRIRGWLKDPAHAAEELDMSIEEAAEYWNSGFALLPSNAATYLSSFSSIMQNETMETSDEAGLEDEVMIQEPLYDATVLEVFKNGTLF